MKIRQDYTITILSFRNLAVLTKGDSEWVDYIQKNATCGASIYDCTFRQAVWNLKRLKSKGFDIQIKK